MTMPRVLVVEDDPQIQKSLSMGLSFSGFEVATASSIAQASAKLSERTYDILLLDVGLPDGSGIELCKKLRMDGNGVPVLFLSARTDEETVVQGMNVGADDYLRKPFGMEELKVRMTRAMRQAEPPRQKLEAGPLSLDLARREATVMEQTISLGPREFDVLAILIKRAGDVVTREQIINQMADRSEVFDRTIDSHVSHLRKKLRSVAGEDVKIAAVYGIGYRLEWKK